MSVSSIQVNNVCVLTELKRQLATLAYDFCVGESSCFRVCNVFLKFYSIYLFFCFEEMTVLGGSHVRLPTITTRYFKRILHDLPLHTLNILVFLSIGFYPVRIIDTENIVLDSGHIDLLLHCKVPCEWIGV